MSGEGLAIGGTLGVVIGAVIGAIAFAAATWLWLPAVGGEWSVIVRILMTILLGYVGAGIGQIAGMLFGGFIGYVFG